jgi:hypothetical protein
MANQHAGILGHPLMETSRQSMNHRPKPDTATATFVDGDITVRLSIPVEDAAQWRTATAEAILGHLGLTPLDARVGVGDEAGLPGDAELVDDDN